MLSGGVLPHSSRPTFLRRAVMIYLPGSTKFSGKTLTNVLHCSNFIKLKFGQFWPRKWGSRGWRSSMVERLICNQQVAGSSPIASSREGILFFPERYPSGQRGRAVNPLAQPTEVRILPSPPLPLGAGIAQWPEHQPSKLRVAGSSPVSRSTFGPT